MLKLPLTYPVYGSTMALNSRVDGLVPGRPIAISGKRQRLRIKYRAVTSSPTEKPRPDPRVPDDFPDIPDLPDIPDIDLPPILVLDAGGFVFLKPGDILSMAAPPMKLVGSVLSALTPEEFGSALGESSPPRLRLQVIDRDGKTGRVDISAEEIELVAAVENDETISEIAFIDDAPDTSITHDRDRTTLQLAADLAYVYDRATVRINANVAAATHGESVQELLGSGDATIPYQTFTLRQLPLTYVSADTPSGSASTLKIFVNDVLWQEAPFFYGRGANERIYILRHDDDGRTTVQFGDGINGARLPTGQNNVRAEYRKGSGLGGLVEAGQISQLLSRPLGLKEVINPESAEGAEDAESRDAARQNAPTTVLTLDRAVSLQDYEDFSRTFAGIAKAQAVWVWDGRKRSIFITVAGVEGEVLEEDGAVISKLKEALREYGDPFVAFTIKSYRQALFQIHGTVTIHADHVVDTVMAAVQAALLDRYSFDARSFGQPVALSEAIATIQSISGVVAVDIDQFYRNDTPTPAWKARLDADRPAMGADGVVAAAELLLLDAVIAQPIESEPMNPEAEKLYNLVAGALPHSRCGARLPAPGAVRSHRRRDRRAARKPRSALRRSVHRDLRRVGGALYRRSDRLPAAARRHGAHGERARRGRQHHRLPAAQRHGHRARATGARRHRLERAGGGVFSVARNQPIHESYPAGKSRDRRLARLGGVGAARHRIQYAGAFGGHAPHRNAKKGATIFPMSVCFFGASTLFR